ncbi:chemotaxis protein CheW [Massilia sp. 9096]|uniref:chemotaxis protein CheW n=1 Tax=Massilia sp. 9096 TaxID=1500894 RepID=UPI000567C72B|nr:chemotaxis protein CheW [Massilia sp. 9096]
MTHPASPALELDDCWRRVGVAGDRSCAALLEHVHCRNCPVYADAAQRRLQRPVDPAYRAAWALELARPYPPRPVLDAAALVFRVGAEWLAAPMALVAAVAPLATPHRLPHRSGANGLLGIVNVDGRLLPAVSLAALLGIDAADADGAGGPGTATPAGRHAFARLLVLASSGQSYALPVDEVHGVLRYAAIALRAPAATLQRTPSPLLAGVIDAGASGAVAAAGSSAAPGIAHGVGLLDGALLEQRLRDLLR